MVKMQARNADAIAMAWQVFLSEDAEKVRTKPFGRGLSTAGNPAEYYFVTYGK